MINDILSSARLVTHPVYEKLNVFSSKYTEFIPGDYKISCVKLVLVNRSVHFSRICRFCDPGSSLACNLNYWLPTYKTLKKPKKIGSMVKSILKVSENAMVLRF